MSSVSGLILRKSFLPCCGRNNGIGISRISPQFVTDYWTINSNQRNSSTAKIKLPRQHQFLKGGQISQRNLLSNSSSVLCQPNCNVESHRKYSTTPEEKVPEAAAATEEESSDNPESSNEEIDYEDTEITLTLSDEDLEKLTKGDPELVKKVQHLQLEHEVWRQEGFQVPSDPIDLIKWQELILLERPGQRRKFYVFLFKLEHTKRNDLAKKEIKRIEREKFLNARPPMEDDPDGMIYGLNRNTLFLRLRLSTEMNFYHNRILQAMKYGPHIIFDCGFHNTMNLHESKACATQLELAFSANRDHTNPYGMHFCNLQKGAFLEQWLMRKIPTLYEPQMPLFTHEESYLDLFPKERLVYLTPHTKDELLEYDADDVFIIGALVDKSDTRPFSLAKAKREGLRMKQLPLDRHLLWGGSTKSLTMDQMMKIMLDWNLTKDWPTAFQHIPRRKLYRQHDNPDANDGENKCINPPPFISRSAGGLDYFRGGKLREQKVRQDIHAAPQPKLNPNQRQFNPSGFSNPKGSPLRSTNVSNDSETFDDRVSKKSISSQFSQSRPAPRAPRKNFRDNNSNVDLSEILSSEK